MSSSYASYKPDGAPEMGAQWQLHAVEATSFESVLVHTSDQHDQSDISGNQDASALDSMSLNPWERTFEQRFYALLKEGNSEAARTLLARYLSAAVTSFDAERIQGLAYKVSEELTHDGFDVDPEFIEPKQELDPENVLRPKFF